MFIQPIDIPDELWSEILKLLQKYKEEIIKMDRRSIGADSFSIDYVQSQLEKDSTYGDFWNIVISHYPYFITDIHRDYISTESTKRRTISEHYVAIMEEEKRNNNINYKESAYMQTLNEYGDEMIFYIEQYPDFIKDSNELFLQMENNPIY